VKKAPVLSWPGLIGLVAGSALFGILLLECGSTTSTSPHDAGAEVQGHDAAKSEAGVDAGPPRHEGTVDRAGRAAVIFALFPDDASAEGGLGNSRNNYNITDTFALTGGGRLDLLLPQDFTAMLARLDALDGKTDWAAPSPLAAPLTTDALLVDPSKPFSPTSYLDIEYTAFALNAPGTHTSCGGRWPGEDAIDKELSILVKKATTGVSGKVTAPATPPTMTFPYLAPPN
jgi:hypothetical protein